MNDKTTTEQIRLAVHKLFEDAGYSVPELLPFIDSLSAENDRMKQELKKLRLASIRGASSADSMNSRLKDALRE